MKTFWKPSRSDSSNFHHDHSQSKEDFLREQLVLEKKNTKFLIEESKRDAQELKQKARLVIKSLQHRINELEKENETLKQDGTFESKPFDSLSCSFLQEDYNNNIQQVSEGNTSLSTTVQDLLPVKNFGTASKSAASVSTCSPYQLRTDVLDTLENIQTSVIPDTSQNKPSAVKSLINQFEQKKSTSNPLDSITPSNELNLSENANLKSSSFPLQKSKSTAFYEETIK
jgi:hypothetical protein